MLKENSVLRAEARASLSGNWTSAVLATLLFAIITSGASCIPFANIVTSFLIVFPIGLSYAVAMLLFFRGTKDKAVNDLFYCFKNYGRSLGVSILTNVYVFLWTLLLIIPGFVKYYSYAMTYYIANDNENMTPDECICESMRMMEGNKMKLFLLDLSFIGWILLSSLSLGIGLLWVTPYIMQAHAAFYQDLLASQIIKVEEPAN